MLAIFLTSTAVCGLVGNPLAGGLMKLDGLLGVRGWQWLFLLEGLPPVLLGAAMLWRVNLLPDDPSQARWLTADERDWIQSALARDDAHLRVNHIADPWAAIADSRLMLLSVIYFMLVMGLYGFVFWAPTLVKSLSGTTDAKVGLLSAIPYLVAVVSMVLIGRHADRAGGRRKHVAACAAIAAVGMTCVAVSHQPVGEMASLCLAAIGIFAALGPFWSIPTRYLRGAAAAGGIAVINSVGALAGFVAPSAIGWAQKSTGHFTAGLLVVAVSLAVGALLVLCVPSSTDAAG
jgi:ACS family tartrate transporter-like MFS transporter